VEVCRSLERDDAVVSRPALGLYVVEAENDYAPIVSAYGLRPTRRQICRVYKPYHLIGGADISILSAALRNEPTGQPHGFAATSPQWQARSARGEMLDGEGGYTVGQTMPASAACRRRAAIDLPVAQVTTTSPTAAVGAEHRRVDPTRHHQRAARRRLFRATASPIAARRRQGWQMPASVCPTPCSRLTIEHFARAQIALATAATSPRKPCVGRRLVAQRRRQDRDVQPSPIRW